MKGYRPILSFDDDKAARAHDERGDEEAAVAFLEHAACGGRALELAIGTGRIALPLSARGVTVDGVELSPAMVARLRDKPGGERLSVTIGDMAELPVDGSYSLIFVVWNSFFNLTTQEAQLRCFQRVAAHLAPEGRFVIEAYVPAFLHRLRDHQQVSAGAVEVDRVELDVIRHDAAQQRLEESHVSLSVAGIELTPVVHRYAWPAELDLMARLAGLRLVERWGGFGREPFQSDSALHVSVYAR